MFALQDLAAIDVTYHYQQSKMPQATDLISSETNMLQLRYPKALVAHGVTSRVDASLFCAPSALLHAADTDQTNSDGTPNSPPPMVMTHIFPPYLLQLHTSKRGQELKIGNYMREYMKALLAKCLQSTTLTDRCWTLLYDPHVLQCLYITIDNTELMSSVVKMIGRYMTVSEGANEISMEMIMTLDHVKMQLEALSDTDLDQE